MFIQPVSLRFRPISIVKTATTIPIPSPLICSGFKIGRDSGDNQADYIEADLDFWICHQK